MHVRTLRMSCAERTQGFLASGKRSFVCQGLHNDSGKKIKGGLNVATVQRCSLVAGQDCKAALFPRQRVFDIVADGEGANLQ